MTQTTHESFSRAEDARPGSNRSFGFVLGGATAILAAINVWHDGHAWPWLGAVSLAFLAAALVYPPVLQPLNRVWFLFGLLLHKIVNPIIMGLIFFFSVAPIGLIMRASGKDLLRLRRDPAAKSYWIVREPPGPAAESFRDQF